MAKYIDVENIDSYYEQVVKRKFSPATITKLLVALGIIIAVFIVSIILMVTVADWLFFIVLTMFGLGTYLIYYLIKHSRVEYEYTFVLGELRIARIKGGAKRRNITYFDVKNIDDLGYYIDAETGKRTIDPSKYPNFLRAAEDEYALDTYYFVIHDKVRKQPALLLMTPNEKTFSLIRPYLSVELKKKVLKMQKEEERFRRLDEQAKMEDALYNKKKSSSADTETDKADTSSVTEETAAETDTPPEPIADTDAAEGTPSDTPVKTNADKQTSSPQRENASDPQKTSRKPSDGGNKGGNGQRKNNSRSRSHKNRGQHPNTSAKREHTTPKAK